MIILASGSPRRRRLLGKITRNFTVVVPNVDENVPKGTPPADMVKELALKKARAVFCAHRNDIVIGADTIVALGNTVLGKPMDEADAIRMLERLSDNSHKVYTGMAICSPEGEWVFHDETIVRFRRLSEAEIISYVNGGEPMDKAGAYGIQGGAAPFVERVEGSISNVIGLPVEKLACFLSSHNFI